jgi:hypothetical protein
VRSECPRQTAPRRGCLLGESADESRARSLEPCEAGEAISGWGSAVKLLSREPESPMESAGHHCRRSAFREPRAQRAGREAGPRSVRPVGGGPSYCESQAARAAAATRPRIGWVSQSACLADPPMHERRKIRGEGKRSEGAEIGRCVYLRSGWLGERPVVSGMSPSACSTPVP